MSLSGDHPPRGAAPLSVTIAIDLERAATALACLDSALAAHPLVPAWAYRARLDAVGRQAAVDGKAIDPWHLAALIEGVRLRLDPAAALVDAARYACSLYQWFSAPDAAQRSAIGAAEQHLATLADGYSPLLGAALAVHTWLERGGDRPLRRAALARYWVHRGVTALPYPLLTGAAALAPEIPRPRPVWVGHFLQAVAAEAEAGIALLRQIECDWLAARRAVAGRRRNRHAGRRSAVVGDLAGTVAGYRDQECDSPARRVCRPRRGQRSDPPRETAALWSDASRPIARGRRAGRSRGAGRADRGRRRPTISSRKPARWRWSRPAPRRCRRVPRPEFDFSDLDRLLDLTDQAIQRVERFLHEHQMAEPTGSLSEG
jgi:hypothetical protein